MSPLAHRLQRAAGWLRGTRWRRLSTTTATLGECPRWSPDGTAVYWVDIPAGRLHRTRVTDASGRPASATDSWSLGAEIAALTVRENGELWAWVDGTVGRFDAGMARFEPVCTMAGLDPVTHRANDGAWAPDGSLWITTMARDGYSPTGALVRVGMDGEATVLCAELAIGNGPAFDGEAALAYVVDSTRQRILRAPLVDRPEFARFAETGTSAGHPDGIAVDSAGRLYVAHYGRAMLSVWTRDGQRLMTIPTPFPCPTAIALRTTASGHIALAITSAAMDGVAGGLWRCILPPTIPR